MHEHPVENQHAIWQCAFLRSKHNLIRIYIKRGALKYAGSIRSERGQQIFVERRLVVVSHPSGGSLWINGCLAAAVGRIFMASHCSSHTADLAES